MLGILYKHFKNVQQRFIVIKILRNKNEGSEHQTESFCRGQSVGEEVRRGWFEVRMSPWAQEGNRSGSKPPAWSLTSCTAKGSEKERREGEGFPNHKRRARMLFGLSLDMAAEKNCLPWDSKSSSFLSLLHGCTFIFPTCTEKYKPRNQHEKSGSIALPWVPCITESKIGLQGWFLSLFHRIPTDKAPPHKRSQCKITKYENKLFHQEEAMRTHGDTHTDRSDSKKFS